MGPRYREKSAESKTSELQQVAGTTSTRKRPLCGLDLRGECPVKRVDRARIETHEARVGIQPHGPRFRFYAGLRSSDGIFES